MSFRKISTRDIQDNFLKLINEDTMLLTAGNRESLNTMTASSGGVGNFWRRDVAYCYIRPGRYTKEFVEREDYFTLSFFDETFKPALTICGRKSGRDTDKVAEAGLTPAFANCGAPYFAEARLVLVCKKIYVEDIDPEKFLDPTMHDWYPRKDYHRLYIGEIVEVLAK